MKNIIKLLIILLLFSCQNKNKKVDNQRIELSKGLNTPVYMNRDTTSIVLSDYILFPEKIDSFAHAKHYHLLWGKGNDTLQILPNEDFKPVENLRIYAQKHFVDVPLYRNSKKEVIFRYAHKGAKKIQFKSQITGWQSVDMQQDSLGWYYKADLDPGNYQYLFVVDGKEILDPENPKKVSNGMGGFNSLYQIALNLDKTPFLQTDTYQNNAFDVVASKDFDSVLVYAQNKLLNEKNVQIKERKIHIKIPQNLTGETYIRLYAYNQFGRSNDVLVPVIDGKVVNNANQLPRTDFHKQIMYFLMVDRFKNGTSSNDKPIKSDSVLPKVNFKGGDIQGVVQVIDQGYFKDLGVNTLWLSPILKNPDKAYGHWQKPPTKFSGYHGYWPVSNIKIDERFGNAKALKELTQKAHRQNTNIILDYVANHVHKDHPLYKQHPDWFTSLYLPDGTMNTEKWDSHRLTTWFDTFLPTIDFSKHKVVEKMTDSAMFWLKNFDIDGFRHDATKHIQLDYWRTLTRKIKTQINRPVYQIGETYGSPQLIRSYINSGMLNGQFNFNLYDAAVAVFAKKDEPISRLSDALQEALFFYGQHNLMGNISGNQDRVRFISYASGDVKFDEDGKQAGWDRKIMVSDTTAYHKLEELQAFNMMIPGVPCIYYGDEYGMPGANDPDNRRMMQFDGLNKHEKNLKQQVKKLIALRKNSMALLYGSTQVEEKDNVLIIKRRYFQDSITAVFNKSDKEIKYDGKTIKAFDYKIIERPVRFLKPDRSE